MEIGEERTAGALVIAPLGRVDSVSSGELERHLVARLDAGERRVVIDMAGVEYISSAGLRVLLALAKRTREGRGALALAALGDSVRQVFELAGFVPLFAIEATRQRAIQVVAES
jgi:anti-anti-sigma factor